MAKQSWSKEEAVLKQRVEFINYQLEEEKKKYEEYKHAHESMIQSLQNSSRESVIGKEEAQSKINDMEQKFLVERKQLEEQYNEYRKRITGDLEGLKKKNNELELALKIQEGESQSEINRLKELFNEADEARTSAQKQLKN